MNTSVWARFAHPCAQRSANLPVTDCPPAAVLLRVNRVRLFAVLLVLVSGFGGDRYRVWHIGALDWFSRDGCRVWRIGALDWFSRDRYRVWRIGVGQVRGRAVNTSVWARFAHPCAQRSANPPVTDCPPAAVLLRVNRVRLFAVLLVLMSGFGGDRYRVWHIGALDWFSRDGYRVWHIGTLDWFGRDGCRVWHIGALDWFSRDRYRVWRIGVGQVRGRAVNTSVWARFAHPCAQRSANPPVTDSPPAAVLLQVEGFIPGDRTVVRISVPGDGSNCKRSGQCRSDTISGRSMLRDKIKATRSSER